MILLTLALACRRDDPTSEAEPNTPDDTGDPEDTGEPTDTGSPTDPTDPPTFWAPAPGTTWQWQLSGAIDPTVDVAVYDIDLFDAPEAVHDQLHADGRRVICYFSAGSYEDFREDASAFPPSAIGEPLDGWPGEWWLDVRDPTVRTILEARLDVAVARGCDAVEPDNVDGYHNDTGFPLTRADQLDFLRFLADASHARGLSVGLKNTVELADTLAPVFDWALNEECLAYDECTRLQPFLDAGKAVFHVEYVNRPSQGPDAAAAVCGDPTIAGFSTLVKTWDLDPWRIACE